MRLVAIPVVIVVAGGCKWFDKTVEGSGKPKTESRQVDAFTTIGLAGAFHGDITVGTTQSVEISGDDNVVPLVTTKSTSQHLEVVTTKPIAPKLDLLAKIATPSLTALSLAGSTETKLRGMAGQTFRLTTSGSAKVVAAGTTHELELSVSGSGTIDAHELTAEDITISVNGSGDVEVAATGVLDVHIAGSGRVRYHGTPREIRKSISGSGTLEQKP